jgi:hypothetical protein
MTDRNQATILLEEHLKELGLRYEREYQFHPVRKWRSDFAIAWTRGHLLLTLPNILIEIEGGISKHEKFHPEWTKMRHQRADGFIKDLEKYNTAAMLGYRLLRFSTQHVIEGQAREFLKRWLC